MKEHSEAHGGKAAETDGTTRAGGRVDRDARRRWIRAVIATPPLVASVASRPVLAARSCTESGQLSGNTSGTQVVCAGEGCSVAFWQANLTLWHYNYQPGDIFDAVFGVFVFGNTATLQDVINGVAPVANPGLACTDAASIQALGAEAVAALQNAATSVAYDLTVQQVIDTVALAIIGNCTQVTTATTDLAALNGQTCPL